MKHVKFARRPSRFWALMHRWRLARAHMPFWRVVVEARPDRRRQTWPIEIDSAVAAIYVWAHTIEEAEAIAALAIEAEGFEPITADAVKHSPAARPSRQPQAVLFGEIGYVHHGDDDGRGRVRNFPGAQT